MFPVGSYVVYQRQGVCRVEEIGSRFFPRSGQPRQLYYTLSPVFQTGSETIYVPVDGPAYLRPIMTGEEAAACLDALDRLEPDLFSTSKVHLLAAHYQELASGSLEDLLMLLKECTVKQAQAEDRKRHLGQVDERYLRLAERLVYGELAVVLHTSPQEVREQVHSRLAGRQAVPAAALAGA